MIPALADVLSGGTVRPVLLHPDPVLRMRCAPAGFLTNVQVRELAGDLLATMYAASGCGLSAPQIGVLRRVFVMDAGWQAGVSSPLVVLDPEILGESDEWGIEMETSLSVPGDPVAMRRALTVLMGCYDLDGQWHGRFLAGTEARIAQQKTDHLDGRLIGDVPA